MFWRRRKHPADDGPLVPHGLISQAMDEPGSELPPDMWDNSPKDVTQAPAEPVEMRLRVSTPAENRLQQPQSLPEQSEISPPTTWPRVDEVEMARRAKGMDTAVSFPYRRPILSSAVPDTEVEPEAEIAEPAKLELVQSPVAPPVATPEPRKLTSILARFHEIRFPSTAPLRQRIDATFSQAKTSVSSGFQLAAKRLQQVRSISGVAFDATKIRVADRTQAAFAQSRSGLQLVREGIRGRDWSQASRGWNRVRSWRVTVRIPAANKKLLASIRERAKSSRLMVQRRMQRDSRLWASLGMAALSALLALVFISEVRHYGGPTRVEAQPTSGHAAPSPRNTVKSDSQVLPNQSFVSQSRTPKPSPIASTTAPRQVAQGNPSTAITQRKDPPSANVKKPRVRRNTDEDDYVAKDTYVFYGNAGKPHR